MERKAAIKFIILRSIGNFLFLFAIFGVIATFGPAFYYEVSFRIIQARGVSFEVSETPTEQLLEEIVEVARAEKLVLPLTVERIEALEAISIWRWYITQSCNFLDQKLNIII